MSDRNGPAPSKPLELKELLTIETDDGRSLEFEVVGTIADEESGESYAVLVHGSDDGEGDEEAEFIVTDSVGNLLEDDDLAQEILDEFLLFAEESDEGEESVHE